MGFFCHTAWGVLQKWKWFILGNAQSYNHELVPLRRLLPRHRHSNLLDDSSLTLEQLPLLLDDTLL